MPVQHYRNLLAFDSRYSFGAVTSVLIAMDSRIALPSSLPLARREMTMRSSQFESASQSELERKRGFVISCSTMTYHYRRIDTMDHSFYLE